MHARTYAFCKMENKNVKHIVRHSIVRFILLLHNSSASYKIWYFIYERNSPKKTKQNARKYIVLPVYVRRGANQQHLLLVFASCRGWPSTGFPQSMHFLNTAYLMYSSEEFCFFSSKNSFVLPQGCVFDQPYNVILFLFLFENLFFQNKTRPAFPRMKA